MIRINQLKLRVGHNKEELADKIRKVCFWDKDFEFTYEIIKQSIDARKKPDIFYIYVVDVTVPEGKNIDRLLKNNQIIRSEKKLYQFPFTCQKQVCDENRPVIVGFGPAGLFCGYMLAIHGFRPIILERGEDLSKRSKTVELFWTEGILNTESNVQFGEGGAGTFSDGKLNTLVKDKFGRNKEVLSILVKAGASEHIMYDYKPHIGTDVLKKVVKNMRIMILEKGGEIQFETKVTRFEIKKNCICGVVTAEGRTIPTKRVILAIGHSARDTFQVLKEENIEMEAKSFAVGLRVEHPQTMINKSQYGVLEHELGAAPYKVTVASRSGRGVYSFCMCPGGYVVNASSEQGRLSVNGMSYSKRDGANANSAIIVSVTPKDFGSDDPLAGVAYQRKLEEKAYQIGGGKIPVAYYKDFRKAVTQTEKYIEKSKIVNENFLPEIKGKWTFAPVHEIMSKECNEAFVEGMEAFGKMISGFDDDNVLLSGIESRTSSPVRILRDETWQSSVRGLYPCGEGAGYAGGITSAAMDGIKIAEVVAECMIKEF